MSYLRHQYFCVFLGGVANILIQEGGVEDLEVIQAAILHDTLEDTETSLEELEETFGKSVYST